MSSPCVVVSCQHRVATGRAGQHTLGHRAGESIVAQEWTCPPCRQIHSWHIGPGMQPPTGRANPLPGQRKLVRSIK